MIIKPRAIFKDPFRTIIFAPDHFAALTLDRSPGLSDGDVNRAVRRAAARA